MNNNVDNNINNNVEEKEKNYYIDPKTGSGYVSSSTSSVDAPIGIILGILLVLVVGGGVLFLFNEDAKESVNEGFESIFETIIGELFYEEEYYYDEDEYYDDGYYEEDDEYYEDEDEYDYSDSDVLPSYYDLNKYTIIRPSQVAPIANGKEIILFIGKQGSINSIKQDLELQKILDKYDTIIYTIEVTGIMNYGENPVILNQFEYDMLTGLTGDHPYDELMKGITPSDLPMVLIMKDNRIVHAFEGFTEADIIDNVLSTRSVPRK